MENRAILSVPISGEMLKELDNKIAGYDLTRSAYINILLRKALNMPTPETPPHVQNIAQSMHTELARRLTDGPLDTRTEFLEFCFKEYTRLHGELPWHAFAKDVARFRYGIINMSIDEIKEYIDKKEQNVSRPTTEREIAP